LERVALSASTLLGFAKLFWPLVEPDREMSAGWAVKCVAEHLEDVSNPDGSIRNLIINIPPRCMKSMLACVFWFAWVWRERPSTRWIYSSFASDLTRRDSVRCRQLVGHPLYRKLWGVQVRDGQDTQTRFANQYEGFRYAVTVGGQGMGEGADFLVCFPYDTPVETDAGRLPIGRVVEERLPVRMLAYDHAAGRAVYRAVEAYESNPGRPAVRVRMSNGAEFTATDEHPVFVTGRGYVPAAAMMPGDGVVTCEAESGVSGLRQGVLPAAGARGAVQDGGVLFAQVPRGRSDRAGEPDVPGRAGGAGLCGVRGSICGRPVDSVPRVRGCEVLFTGLSRCHDPGEPAPEVHAGDPAVRLLRRRGDQEGRPHRSGVLRPPVCESFSRGGDEGGGKPAVRARPVRVDIPGRIPSAQADDPATRSALVSELRHGAGRARVEIAGSPHQLRQDRQPAVEPRDGVPLVSRADARVAGEPFALGAAVVVSVERAAQPDRVYNVRVADDHNYFAAGVLVHNCDDPINPRRARSAVERAACVHWWRATMARRVTDERTVRRVVIMQRLHEGDLTGYLTAEQTGWDHLVLPMRYEPRRYVFFGAAAGRPAAQPAAPPATADDATLAGATAAAGATADPGAARDLIRPTALQQAHPHLRDGPAGSGREQPGDLLWADRFPAEVVAKAEAELGPEAPGQYAQRPSSEAGDVFRRETFRRFEPTWELRTDPATGVEAAVFSGVRLHGPGDGQVRVFRAEQLTYFQTVDTALSETSRTAFTAVATCFATPEYDLGVWGMFRAKLDVQYQYDAITALRAGPAYWNPKARALAAGPPWPFVVRFQAVERKASGYGLIQQAAAAGKPLHALDVEGDKVQRAVPVASMYVNGKVYHPPPSRPWVVELEDELCLAAGTKVLLMRGEVEVEKVLTGDYAYTRSGWRPVTWAGQTHPGAKLCEIKTAGGFVIRVTPSHPIFCPGSGFIPAGRLRAGSALLRCTGVSCSDLTLTAGTGTLRAWSPADSPAYITTPTNAKSVPSRPDITFTTRTGTRGTTELTTWSASLREIISAGTGPTFRRRNGSIGRAAFAGSSTLPAAENPKRVPRSAETAFSFGVATRPFTAAPVSSAGLPSGLERRRLGAAARSAPSGLPGRVASLVLDEIVSVSAVPGLHPVYNLSVADDPEYFANGILTHNCVFPNGTYKDQADCVAYAGYLVTHDKLLRAVARDRPMADPGADDPPPGAPTVDADGNPVPPAGNTFTVSVGGGDVTVEFPQDDGWLGGWR